MNFELIGKISNIEIIAVGREIRMLSVLKERYGQANWRKLKGIATVRLYDGTIRVAEIHWFEAHGIGRKKMRIKQILDE